MPAMNKRPDTAIRRWLEAEIAGLEQRAETRLAAAFAVLPAPLPRSGFTASTMARLGLARRRAERRLVLAFRLSVMASLALGGLAIGLMPRVLAPWISGFEAGALVGWASGAVVAIAQRLGQAATFWGLLGEVAAIVAETLQAPSVLAALTLSMALSFASLRALTGLVAVERRENHA